jgi:D-3-phosphoglycerate dehydrogenase
VAQKNTALVSRKVLSTYLESARSDGQVNIVNAPAIAKEMGLDTIESTINAATEYSELVVAELTKGDKKFRVSGTVIGKSPRVVEIDKLFVDINTAGEFLIVKNDDRPGIVGAVGTTLGNASANIANLSLARNLSEGCALTVIELDAPLNSEVMNEIREVAGVTLATGISL